MNTEAKKLTKHLEILREEHVKLQESYANLKQQYEMLAASVDATCGLSSQTTSASESSADSAALTAVDVDDSFVFRLVKTVSQLFEKELYSDVTIHLDGHQLRAHRFVLAARSNDWGVADLSTADRITFPESVSYNIGYTLLKWVYTDKLEPKLGDNYLLELLRASKLFSLSALSDRCEQLLVSRLERGNCIPFYQLADEVGCANLREKASALITARWEEFSGVDFEEMSANLLYRMLKSKGPFVLHSAIRLGREDVVFLYLVENDAELGVLLNRPDERNELPLSLALSVSSAGDSIAKTLLSHKADVDAVDSIGLSLLFKAVECYNAFACDFLIKHGADVSFVLPSNGESLLHALCSASLKVAESEMNGQAREVPSLTVIADLLLAQQALNFNAKNAKGKSALHLCVERNDAVLMAKLAAAGGIDLNLTDDEGYTALRRALLNFDDLRLAESLIPYGADVNFLDKDGNSLLHDAVLLGAEQAEKKVAFLLARGARPNVQNTEGLTPLHLAARNRLLAVVEALIAAEADPSLQAVDSAGGRNALHEAVLGADGAVISAMFSSPFKLDLSATDNAGETALSLALWCEQFETAKLLIQRGAAVVGRSGEQLPLLLRAIDRRPRSPVAVFLLENGASPAVRTPSGETSLQLAIRRVASAQTVRALCQRGADLNARDARDLPPLWTALEIAEAAEGEDRKAAEEVALILVKFGCDVDGWHEQMAGESVRGCQQTLLHRALDERLDFAGRFLIRSGCNVNVLKRLGVGGEGQEEVAQQQTALHMVSSWSLPPSLASVLIEHGADVNALDGDGRTAIHLAVLNLDLAVLKALLASEAVSLSTKDKYGQTPFAAAMHVGSNVAAKALLEKEPRVANQVDGKGYSYLHTAVHNADLESVLFLLSIGVPVDQPTKEAARMTPLAIACQIGDDMIVRNLILAGADVNAPTGRNRTALLIAASREHASILTILLENGADVHTLDDSLNNALHNAVQTGSLSCVKALLTQSSVPVDAVNISRQTVFHLLGIHGKENAVALFDYLYETTAADSALLDNTDIDGNTMLLLAYMSGNAQLCRSAVRTGVSLGHTNSYGVSIFNYQTPTKQLLFRLLVVSDTLTKEPRWAEGDFCSECGTKFSFATRKHHCRHCGRLLCSKCSERTMPILKYDLQKPVRLCDVCYDVLTLDTR